MGTPDAEAGLHVLHAGAPAQRPPADPPQPGSPRRRRPGPDRTVPGAVAVLLALVLVDLTTGAVLVSTLGIVVVAVGILGRPRQVLQVGAVAVVLGLSLVSTVHRDDVAPLRVGNIVIGTALAWAGSTARTRREEKVALLERQHREARLAEEQRLVRMRVLEEEHRRLFRELQEALVPALPPVAGADLDLAYLPADDAAPSGGDLHEVRVLPDGTVLAVVVDAVGHGVRSTRDALRVVHLAGSLLLTGTPLADVFAEVDRLLVPSDEDAAATAVAVHYDPGTGAVRVAAAGHPPPLVVRRGGGTLWLEAAGVPVGYPGAGSDGVVQAQLEVGDLLVVYTDGLVEAGRDLVRGLEELAGAAADAHDRPLDGWAHRLVAATLAGRARRDDVLVLALRRTA